MKLFTLLAPTPGRVLGLVRLLEGQPARGLPRCELVRLLDPSTGPGAEPDHVREVLQAATEAGLTEEITDPARSVRLAGGLPERPSTALPDLIARAALRPEIGGAENRFAKVCAWLLAQPPLGVPQWHAALQTDLEKGGLPLKEIGLQNAARIDMVLYWARYLGLIDRVRDEAGRGVVADPTAFLRRHLHDLLPTEEGIDAPTFRDRLGALCPVLDGGVVRSAVLERLRQAGAPAWPEGQLSEALSLALRRLRAEGALHWVYRDDARTFLDLSRGERVSEFRRGPDPKGVRE